MNVCLYCTCMGQLAETLPADAFREALGTGVRLVTVDRLCDRGACQTALGRLQGARILVAAACSKGARGAEALMHLKALAPDARAGLADIREGCVWPGGRSESAEVAAQAAAQVRMRLAALTGAVLPVPDRPRQPGGALVVGGGPAGMAAASALAGLGVPVTLSERRPGTGGMLNQLDLLFPDLTDAGAVRSSLSLEGVKVLTGTDVLCLRRDAGAYAAVLRAGGRETEARFAAVILAMGGTPVLPGTRFRAGEIRGVISQMELETLLNAVERGDKGGESLPQKAVFVQCVHAREDEAPYCSSICCPTAVKNALRLKTHKPDAAVTVLNRQMVMPGIALEALYRKARRSGVRFLHVEDMSRLRVEGEKTVHAVIVPASAGGAEERIEADRLVCSTPVRPAGSSAKLAGQLGLRLDEMRFVRGHEPVHPLETDAAGVFLCGSARWPSSVAQAVEQGRAAAALAAQYLSGRRIAGGGLPDQSAPASIRPTLCSGCGRCMEACPHGACRADPAGSCSVDQERCRRCGVCAAVCPCGAAYFPGASPSPRELLAALGAGGGKVSRGRWS